MVMEIAKRAGFPAIGVLFLALAVVKVLQGDNWVVWAILGVFFGGLAVFRAKKQGGSE
jgi:hypothetical protein